MPNFSKIVDRIDDAIATFIERIPASERAMLYAVDDELRKLDVSAGKIKPTIGNLRIVNSIKNRLLSVVLTDEYKGSVKQFLKSFNEITVLQNEFCRSIEKEFKPSSILKEIKKVAIEDTASKLLEAGLDVNVAQPVKDILTTNITTGGSYQDLADQLREALTTTETEGLLGKYAKQIAVDSTNQYSRNYTQIVSSDLGYEWFAYQNTLIKTSREFCIAMHERRYFHISEVPNLLKAKDLYYTDQKTKERRAVRLNKKTGLPNGMYETTTVSNFMTLLGGYNCGHQAGPVSERLVKMQDPTLFNQISNSPEYKNWQKNK